jgi:hypothetical protein
MSDLRQAKDVLDALDGSLAELTGGEAGAVEDLDCNNAPCPSSPLPGPCSIEFSYCEGCAPVQELVFEYSGSGKVTLETARTPPNQIDWVAFYVYDDKDFLIAWQRDDLGDGTIDVSVAYTNDSLGNLLKAETDVGADGTIDEVVAYSYDGGGLRQSRSFDANADGTPDRTEKYEYDSNGRIETRAIDADADGVVDLQVVFIYGPNGDLVSVETFGPDGKAVSVCLHTHESFPCKKVLTVDCTSYVGEGSSSMTVVEDLHGNVLELVVVKQGLELVIQADLMTFQYSCWCAI